MSIYILKLVVLVLLIINLDTSKSTRFYSVALYQLSFKPRYRIKIFKHRIIQMQLPAILLRLLFLKFLVILRQILALTEPGVKTKSQAILLVNDQLVKCVQRSLTPMILEYFDFRTLSICLVSRNMTSS